MTVRYAINYKEELESVVRAVHITSPTSYLWFGRRALRLPPKIVRALTPQAARSFLLYTLRSQLYTSFYCPGQAIPSGDQMPLPPLTTGPNPFVEALSMANCGDGYWESGWEVSAVEANQVSARKGGLELLARQGEYLPSDSGPPAPGIFISLRFPKGLPFISPGYYMALSDAPFPQDQGRQIVRLYWHLVMVEGAPQLMQALTSRLNAARLPFRFKLLNDPGRYKRCDAAVLYFAKDDYAAIIPIVARIYPEIVPFLGENTPALTRPLAPGLGFAEDPGGGDSFGLHRCRLVADALVLAYERGRRDIDDRLSAVQEGFTEAGISLEHPYLNPGSSDGYTLPLSPTTYLSAVSPAFDHPGLDALLETAARIGDKICREAIWHEALCNWLGVESSPGHAQGVTYRALSPYLYAGTSGVALFLAQLYALTGDPEARRTAEGALSQALSRVCAGIREHNPLGLYTGAAGVALAAARVGILLRQEKWLARAAEVAASAITLANEEHEFDLLSGIAGAVVALLHLGESLESRELLDSAARLGDELVQSAEPNPAGCSWPSRHVRHRRNLTGFSHGAAGVGYALLKLFVATGDARYRQAAEGAFLYERHWYSSAEENWPDFRDEAGRGRVVKRAHHVPFATYWCHGAPGIALSRLYAHEVLGDEVYRAEADIALGTTRRTVQQLLLRGGNYSLCHGLAGNAEVLAEDRNKISNMKSANKELLLKVAAAGIRAYANRENGWPCGVAGGETPGLMLGTSGIGYFYLRAYRPELPSMLML